MELDIAREAEWLLRNPTFDVSAVDLRQRVVARLTEIGLATYTGRIRVGRLLDEFSDLFAIEVLANTGCALEDHSESWVVCARARPWLTGFTLQG
jgi:hypothetical protein